MQFYRNRTNMKEQIIAEFNKLNNFNKKITLLTIVLLIYGYLCRTLNLYFFWESKTLGWALLFVTIISILSQRIQKNKLQNKKTLSEEIFIGLIVFILLIQAIFFYIIHQTSAYKLAKEYLYTNKTIISKVGQVKGIFLKPVGRMSISSSSEGETGQAELIFVVKGTKKYIDISLELEKDINTNWAIIKTK